jgi:murein peptide amidase A
MVTARLTDNAIVVAPAAMSDTVPGRRYPGGGDLASFGLRHALLLWDERRQRVEPGPVVSTRPRLAVRSTVARWDSGVASRAMSARSRMRPAGLIATVCCLWVANPAHANRVVFGHSVHGRPLVAWSFGSSEARRKVLVVGCIHGNECSGLAITSALRHEPIPSGVQLWVVPEMNPDGTAADTRQNADGVDLNRNFPYRWERITDPVFNSGPRPASEPETRAAIRLVRRVRPAVTIWYHQHMDLVDEAGGDLGVARRYAQIVGLRAACLTFLSGVATGWSNHAFPGTTSFVVELPAGPVSPAALGRHLRALRAMELGERSGSATHCDSITTAA